MTTTPVDLYRVILREPVTYVPTGPTTGITVGAPAEGSFDPANVRITPAPDVRPGDVVLGTIQPHYDGLCQPIDRAQWVSYFTGELKAEQHGARPFDPAHCDLCAHNGYIRQIGSGSDWVSVDGCTLYSPGCLLLTIPRELAVQDPDCDPYAAERRMRQLAYDLFQKAGRRQAMKLLTRPAL